MKQRVKDLIDRGSRLFSDRRPLLSTWQDMAMNFYPERADFTVQRSIGIEFASHLMTGEPVMARRDMANTLSAMLRPRGQPWFMAITNDEAINKDPDAKKWLEWASEIMRKFMYENNAKFIRSTKEADNDFVTFGQCVIEARENKARDGLIYLCYHLRDVVWNEDEELNVNQVHRDGKLRASQMISLFDKKGMGYFGIHPKVTEAQEKDPEKKFGTRHIIMPRDEYDLKDAPDEKRRYGQRLPWVSIHVDVENEHILEECGRPTMDYIIPRWQTVSGTQYAHSPATVVAISNSRMLQQITLTLMEAGQKSVDPPLIATAEMIQGGINTYAGGITWVDAEYDEKLGEVLRPLSVERSGLQWGDALQERISNLIKEAFYLNQISMPDTTGEMTAYEVQKRFEEYIRRALPLFEPMETEYNGAICDRTFEILLRNGAFGNADMMPDILRGQEVKFSFSSPLQKAQNRANSQAFMESANLLKIALELDPSVRHIVDVETAARDALEGAQAPATWFNSKEDVAQIRQQEAQQAQEQQMAAQMQQGAEIAGQAGDAMQKMRAALQAQPDQGQEDLSLQTGAGKKSSAGGEPLQTGNPLAELQAAFGG